MSLHELSQHTLQSAGLAQQKFMSYSSRARESQCLQAFSLLCMPVATLCSAPLSLFMCTYREEPLFCKSTHLTSYFKTAPALNRATHINAGMRDKIQYREVTCSNINTEQTKRTPEIRHFLHLHISCQMVAPFT